MADKEDTNDKKKKKSIIASLDLKNYKAKYTDSYGLGKPNEADLDNFLIAEPDSKNEPNKDTKEPLLKKTSPVKSNSRSVADPIAPIGTASTANVAKADSAANDVKPSSIDQVKSVSNIQPARDSDFERRVNAEADNDFYDEKPNQQIDNTFRSGAINRKSTVSDNSLPQSPADTKETKSNRKLNLREPIKVNVRHEIKDRLEYDDVSTTEKKPIRRTETYGIVISAVALIYSILTKDKPLLFLSVSLLLFLTRPVIAAPFGKYSQSIQNAIKGFSIALFIGSIFFIFL